jgi:hypothetical protein
MRQLSPDGQQVVNDIAQRHGFSPDAVTSMLDAVINGNGSMAQFSHPEFGGSGQWMRGGMTMVSDMFNNHLKGRVDALCEQLAGVVASHPNLTQTGSFQSQSQGCTGQSYQGQSSFGGQSFGGQSSPSSLFIPAQGGGWGSWWPSDLGAPNSTGSQNGARYAYFAQARRLAIDVGGQVTVYDTLDHQIGGVSQQQSYGGSLSFTSQYGLVDVASLPIVSGFSQAPPPAPQQQQQPAPFWQSSSAPSAAETDIFAAIEKLAGLRDKGYLNDEEFSRKKAELLARL